MATQDVTEMSREALEYELEHWRYVMLEQPVQQQPLPEHLAKLTVTEERILRHLWKRSGWFVTRETLNDCCFPLNEYREERTIDSHIKRLRKALKKAGVRTKITTSYNRGYTIARSEPDPFLPPNNETEEETQWNNHWKNYLTSRTVSTTSNPTHNG